MREKARVSDQRAASRGAGLFSQLFLLLLKAEQSLRLHMLFLDLLCDHLELLGVQVGIQ